MDSALRQAVDRLRDAGEAAVTEAASRVELYLMTSRGAFGPLAKLYPTGQALLGAIESGGEELGPADRAKLRAAPLRLLAMVAPAEAERLALDALVRLLDTPATEQDPERDALLDACAAALGSSRADEAPTALLRAMRDAANRTKPGTMARLAFVRRDVVRAVESLEHPTMAGALGGTLEAALRSPRGDWAELSEAERTFAAALLHALGARGAAGPLLVDVAADHADAELRKSAATALENAKDPAALEALGHRIGRPGALERALCITALLRLDSKRAFDAVAPLVERFDEPDARAVARAALGVLERDAARAQTSKITGAPEGWLQADERWVDLALRLLEVGVGRSDVDLGRAAVEVLGRSGDRRAIPALLGELGQADAEPICRALERIGDASIVGALAERLPTLESRRDRGAVEALLRALSPQAEGEANAAASADQAAGGPPGHVIETAKSGRSACRSCKQPIAKGELRLGEEVPNPFSDRGGNTLRWHHLKCAAEKRPLALKIGMERFEGELPDRADLEATIGAWEKKRAERGAPSAYPYAERATTARSRCLGCGGGIAKGVLRVAVLRDVRAGTMVTQGPGYLHARCAKAYVSDEKLLDTLKANSVALSADDLALLAAELGEGARAE